eukprot:TRINITY_DN52294_c0_g1_i1.p1 TRINITY_DN52294_c0_g1~~TRINITY_DN52294_c0_g1_i1.p1  ORF type:complete len:376 (-),score=30.78 TRINITY_DN52294_c0_g1_i1:15-1142(-)
MAIAALRVVMGQLPTDTYPALKVALRPSPRRSTCAASAALSLAASWFPEATPSAAAVAAATSRSLRRSCRRSVIRLVTGHGSNPTAAASALAVAVRQQPRTMATRAVALAAGRALLRDGRAIGSQPTQQSIARLALAIMAGRASPDVAAALIAVSKPRARPIARRTTCRSTCGAVARLPPAFVEPPDSSALTNCQVLGSDSYSPFLCADTSVCVIQPLLPPIPLAYTTGTLWQKPEDMRVVDALVDETRASQSAEFGIVALGDAVGQAAQNAVAAAWRVCPLTLERRLRQSAPLLHDLQQVSVVCTAWAHCVNQQGWPSTYIYLYNESGSKAELQRRYFDSKRQLLATDWLRCMTNSIRAPSLEVVVRGIAAFIP